MLKIIGSNPPALQQRLINCARAGGRVIVIVPEQYTLQIERDLMGGLEAAGFFDLEVLSPSRLTERVFARAGTDSRVRIDARGKQLALARALLGCKKQLRYYESAVDKQGFIQRAGTLIADLKRAGVSPDQLQAHADALAEGAARDKLQDLALLFTAYEEQLAGQFVDGEDVQDAMLARLPDSGIARDAQVIVYGFDVLTGQMNHLLLALSAQAAETTVLIALERQEAFAPVLESVGRLRRAAEEAAIPCTFLLVPAADGMRAPELSHLGREYLCVPGTPWEGPCGRIRLFAAPSPYFEAHFAAQEMLLLHERGVAFGDMAVVMGDSGFAGLLSTVLADYRIPAYIARKLPAASHGAARFLLSSLAAIGGGYPATDMIGVIKSGYAPLDEQECWLLENYILSYGIRGKHWLSPFTRGSDEERAAIEDARARLIAPMEALRHALAQAPDAGQALRMIYAYLDEAQVYPQLQETQEQLLAEDMAAEAVQAKQVWDALMQLLSQAYALLGNAKVSARQLSSWLEAGLEACELSSLPPSGDAVMCGPLGSLPLARPRVLFLMNLTDGILSAAAPGLLTDEEQEQAQQALHAYLALNDEGKDCLARLDVWKALSAPTEYLYLTRAQATQDGGALRPFAQLAHIRRLFPALVEEGGVSQHVAARLPLSPGPTLDALGQKMRAGQLQGEWLEAWRYLCQAPETRDQAAALRAAFAAPAVPPPLPRQVTHALFMERVMSVSRLESFAVCPYRHFVEQGLSPRPRKEWTLTPIDAGNFYHSALEGFTRLLPTLPAWPKIDKKTCDAVIDQAAQPLFDQLLSGVMGDSARMRALGDKYRRVLRRVAWTFTKGARQSAFSPAFAEVRFGYPGGIPPIPLHLESGETVYVRGIIDRIDRYAGDEGVYLRVVDYKSGAERLDPARIFWGAQLQLLLYLQAALGTEEGAQPAGAFYMRVADPLLPDAEETAQIEDALARALSLKGLALKDAAILQKMDDGTPPLTLPKVMTAGGEFDKRAMLATLADLQALIGHAEKMAGRLAERMRSGEIAPRPLCGKDGKGPCENCDYAAICRADASQKQGNAQVMQDMDLDELLARINP